MAGVSRAVSWLSDSAGQLTTHMTMMTRRLHGPPRDLARTDSAVERPRSSGPGRRENSIEQTRPSSDLALTDPAAERPRSNRPGRRETSIERPSPQAVTWPPRETLHGRTQPPGDLARTDQAAERHRSTPPYIIVTFQASSM